jgi:hypothetical protein
MKQIVVWSNKIRSPFLGHEFRQLSVFVPSFERWSVRAETIVGYEVSDLVSDFDGMHSRNLHFVILGFGLTFYRSWNSDGR